MMNLTLQITASAGTLATILASLPADATVEAPNAPSIPIGSGMPVAPVMAPSPPSMAAPTPPAPSLPSSDDDDTGEAAEGTPDRDANGLPWDERIHSAGKNRLNADGTWRKRRGVDDATVAIVEQELRGAPPPAMQIPMQPIPLPPTIPAIPQAAPVPQPIPVAAPIPAPAPAPMQDAVNAAMGMPTAPVPAPAAAPWTPGSLDFLGMMQHLGPKFQERDATGAPLLHADYLAQLTGEISTAFQLPTPLNAFTDIQGNQQQVDYAVQLLMRDGKW